MLLTLKWMDNLQQTECNQRICHLFFIFNLICCKFVALKRNTLSHSFQIHYCKQTKSSPHSSTLCGDQVSLRQYIGVGMPGRPKILSFPLLLNITPTKKLSPHVPLLIADSILEKKVSLMASRQILPKILLAAYIFRNTIMTNLKKLIGNKSPNTKQCPAGLSPRIIPKTLLETLGMEENISQQSKTYSFLLSEKSSLINLHLPSNLHLHQFSSNHPIQGSFVQGNSIYEGITTKLILLKQGAQLLLICFPEVILKSAYTPPFFN